MANYFKDMKSSELAELQHDLNSSKPDERKEAAKQVIAMMTIGKDVSALFPHMVKCMETQSIELKKLVYLYIINYAKSKPDFCIMAVNSFQKDSREKLNPLMRALAVRTMGCIRIERITEYLCESLKTALSDDDPYVKKTAATAVAKLYMTSPRLVKDHQFIKQLQNMLLDGNAIVVANACAALLEISKSSEKNYLPFKKGQFLNKVLAAVNDSNEWGQVYILEALGHHDITDAKEAENIVERVLPRLAHNNPAVILSAIKVILKALDHLEAKSDLKKGVGKKLAAPLVSLLSCEAEIQYVSLRNINFILQKQPTIFQDNIKVFFCKFNDPIYVKLEKIEILIKVTEDKNAESVLNELQDYSNDMDMDLVTASVKAIGQIILKVNRSLSRAVEIIQQIVQNGQPIAIQEAVIIAKDIFRRFPNKYEKLLKDLTSKMEDYTEPESKCAIAWIIGEYAEKIDESEKILEQQIEMFLEEEDSVKLALLTATVKLYMKKPDEGEDLIQKILQLATEEADNPDLKDRAYIYWRMLSTSPQKAQDVVLCKKPQIAHDSYNIYDEEFVDKLIDQISSMSSIYHKTRTEWNYQIGKYERKPVTAATEEVKATPAAKEEKPKKRAEKPKKKPAQEESSSEEEEKPKKKVKKVKKEEKVEPAEPTPVQQQPPAGDVMNLDDLLGMGSGQPTAPATDFGGLGGLDLGGNTAQAQAQVSQQPPAQEGFGFGFDQQQPEAQADAGGDWANMDSAFGGSPSLPNDFAKGPLVEVLSAAQKGKQGKSGLGIRGHVFVEDKQTLTLGLEFNNQTEQALSGFDIMINKNPFAVHVTGASNKIEFPAPGSTAYGTVPLTINKNNLDAKSPPKSPFIIQIAMKSSLDVFYFNVNCHVHNLINFAQPINKEEFKGFWEKIGKKNEFSLNVAPDQLYGGFNKADLATSLIEGLDVNGFVNMVRIRGKQDTATMCYFGAKTINNLPMLFEVAIPDDGSELNVVYKVPVMPLKPLVEEALKHILTRQE